MATKKKAAAKTEKKTPAKVDYKIGQRVKINGVTPGKVAKIRNSAVGHFIDIEVTTTKMVTARPSQVAGY